MSLSQRIPTFLRRICSPSSIHLLLLIASDPKWEPLFRSAKNGSPRARFKNPSPWWAWHAIPVVEQFLKERQHAKILEWGSGGSTLWYFQQGVSVTSIEHDREWFQLCQEFVGTRAELRHITLDNGYATPDVDYGSLDCIVIDGMMRNECSKTVAEKIQKGVIKPGTLIVFDNSNLADFAPGIEILENCCSRWRSYAGTTCRDIDQMTTLFYV